MIKTILVLIFFFLNNSLVFASELSLNLKDLELREALQRLAQIANETILIDDSVQGRLTLQLENTSFESAIEKIAYMKGLSYRRQDKAIYITAKNKDDKIQGPVHTLYLSNISAKEAAETLKDIFPNCLWPVESSNLLIFSGNQEELSKLKTILASLDKPQKQINMEAKIISLNEEASKNLGVTWGWENIPQKRIGTSASDHPGGNFNFWKGNSFRFEATLNALLAKGKAKIIAKPSLLSLPGKEAQLFIGDHIPVQTEKRDSKGSYTSTEYVDAGIKLQYTSFPSQDDKTITAKVHTEVATATLVSELTNYKITSRTADTNVRLQDGETLVIGGLINEEEQKNLQKIPLLGDIPLLGALFRSSYTRKSKVEVIILLTPHIISDEISQKPDSNTKLTASASN